MAQNGTPGTKFAFALALASGTSITAAAEQAGISRRTAHRRLSDPNFRKLVSQLRAELFSQALGRAADALTRAADTAAALLDDASPAIRLRAVRALASLGLRLHGQVDLEDRVHIVEDEIARRRQ